ncbi:MAG: hypothetical protein KC656_20565, partial [Myxococcales bacterium]|nr:hypothetical protein [Myxococcales bacterium]
MFPDVPGYRVQECLHTSDPRIVYRAVDADDRPVVLKTLSPRYPLRRDVAEIRREFELMRRLRIPGVMQVERCVEHGAGNVAIVMEPFGRSLAMV